MRHCHLVSKRTFSLSTFSWILLFSAPHMLLYTAECKDFHVTGVYHTGHENDFLYDMKSTYN